MMHAPPFAIRPLGSLKELRLNEIDARGLLGMFYEVFGNPGDYELLVDAWNDFIESQDFIASRITYADWRAQNGKLLLSIAEGFFALQTGFQNFLPGRLEPAVVDLSDEDRRGLFMWYLLRKAFMDDDLELLRECALCWQAFPHVVAEIDRRSRESKNKAGFWRAQHLYFTESEDRNIYGAASMREGAVHEIARMAWKKLPSEIKQKLDAGQTLDNDNRDRSGAILAQTLETLLKDKNIHPMEGLGKWLDGVFNHGPLAVRRDIQDDLKRPQQKQEQWLETLKAGAAEIPALVNDSGEFFRREYELKLLEEYCEAHPGDKRLLYAKHHIDGMTIGKLARKMRRTREWVGQKTKEARQRFLDWWAAKEKL